MLSSEDKKSACQAFRLLLPVFEPHQVDLTNIPGKSQFCVKARHLWQAIEFDLFHPLQCCMTQNQ
jgi:hypothetical protein